MSPDVNLATIWEAVADAVPDQMALACGDVVRSYAAFDDRAARLAAALGEHGVGHDSKVGLLLYNGNEYSEVEFAAFKARAIPANLNYRYLPDELAYVCNNADAEAVFYDASLRDRVERMRGSVPTAKLYVEVAGAESPASSTPDWAVAYEQLIDGHDAAPRITRSGDDLWFLYTGGTTGRPKAVMWPHATLLEGMETTFKPFKLTPPTSPEEAAEAAWTITSAGHEIRQLAASPLMHGTAGLGQKSTFSHGGAVLTLANPSFDADELWRCVQRHGATMLSIVGDAFSRPMITALDQAIQRGDPYDLSTLRLIISSGVMWSAQIKDELLAHHKMTLVDVLGSSEASGMARQVSNRKMQGTTAKFSLSEHSSVFTDEGVAVQPGSGQRGRLALGRGIPLGYYKDQGATDKTFPEIDGRRWSIPGDYATVEADGTITLLGRGSVCINTGGEKVYPEEVEESLKEHPDVIDANVFGVDDEKWGAAVNAVVSCTPGTTLTEAELIAHAKERMAAYKAPKRVIFVDEVARGANGKPDYTWARAIAMDPARR